MGIPLKPIVNNRGSVCHPLSCFLVGIFTPLMGKSISYVKNSAYFAEKISNAPIHSYQMVSLNAEIQFTKVPTDQTLTVVQDMMVVDSSLEEYTSIPIDNLVEMLIFCVKMIYFGMGSDIYQLEKLTTESLLSPVLANIYMQYFEKMTLGSTSLKPSMWLDT